MARTMKENCGMIYCIFVKHFSGLNYIVYIYLSEVVNLTWWRFSPKLHIVGFSLFLLLFLCGEFNVMKMWRFSPKHVFWGVPFYCTCEVSLPVESIFVLSCGQVVQCDCSGFLLLFWLFGVFIIILIWNIFSYYLWSMEHWVRMGTIHEKSTCYTFSTRYTIPFLYIRVLWLSLSVFVSLVAVIN